MRVLRERFEAEQVEATDCAYMEYGHEFPDYYGSMRGATDGPLMLAISL